MRKRKVLVAAKTIQEIVDGCFKGTKKAQEIAGLVQFPFRGSLWSISFSQRKLLKISDANPDVAVDPEPKIFNF